MPLIGWRTNWIDSFGRTAGAVGPNWTTGITTNSGETPTMPTIVTGGTGYAWVQGPSNTGVAPIPVGTMHWATPVVEPDQYIDVKIGNWHHGGVTGLMTAVEIHNHCGTVAAGQPRRVARFQCTRTGTVSTLTVSAFTRDGAGGATTGVTVTYTPLVSGDYDDRTLRLASYASGRQVVTFDGEVIIDYVEASTPAGLGYDQGIWMQWLFVSGRASPYVHHVQGGGDYGPVRLPFHGVIGEITIHDHALDDDEMLALLNYYDIQYASGQYH